MRRALIGLGAVAASAIVLFPTSLAYVVTHTLRSDVREAQLGGPHEVVSFETTDGLRLEGWFVPSRNGATVIAFPGRAGPQKHARMLIRHGYGVLLFDRRGEGVSEATRMSSAGSATATSMQPRPIFAAARTSTRSGSVRSASLSAARC